MPSWIQLTCLDKTLIAPDFVCFLFAVPNELKDFGHQAGQYLPIRVQINKQTFERNYSLSSAPSNHLATTVSVCVKRVKGGKVSNWLIDNLHPGQSIEAKRPTGDFSLKPSHQPLLLLSAGSGITPMLSMLRFLAQSDQLDKVIFYHQCRHLVDFPYLDEINALAKRHLGLSVHICLTEPPSSWQGLKGRFAMSHLNALNFLPADKESSPYVYCCGPEAFMKKAQHLLLKKGLEPSHYFSEAFSLELTPPTERLSVSIEINDQQFQGDNQSSLLSQALAHGIKIPNACQAGLCKSCQVDKVYGDYVSASDEHQNQDSLLACACIPLTDVKVRFK